MGSKNAVTDARNARLSHPRTEVAMSRKAKAEEFVNEMYNITVTGRNVQVTDAMKDYAIEKISKLERFSARIIDVNVTIEVQKLDHRVDIVMKVNHLKIKSQAVSTDMYVSIDKAVDKIAAQLRKYKNRLQDHQARNLQAIEMNVNVVGMSGEDEINDEIESESRRLMIDTFIPHQVISKEKKALKQLRVDEAMMKLELSGDHFLIFRSEEDTKLKVIYRRNDGHYGVIEVES